MTQDVRRGWLADSRAKNSLSHCLLHCRFVKMMPALDSGFLIKVTCRRRKSPLPTLLAVRVRVLSRQSIWQHYSTCTFAKVPLM
jgi:hypothetical protein